MAEYVPVHEDNHYIERDTGSGAGFWAVLAIIIVVLALLLFGSRIFSRNGTSSGTNINGTVNVPSGGGGSTGTGGGSGGSTGTY